ncbi:Wadjet anti-phage system protein JetD domain-containing protein [Sphingopyxis sp. KK2]|uniref:Wadjet anti-phage system protein JetD domain-containing protein n=1 Tax=Sphingopyxis sp. KK2 TaxID=1855727 RepID=UPI0009F8D7F9|nr:Wadjet anti-phage system protein JetD domain-containing protein [Sphingopyxis sp. KK2]
MKRHTDPRELLNALLDRHERGGGQSRRITAHPSQAFTDRAARDHLTEALKAAREAGSITIDWDRDAPHLIARIVLADPAALYRLLGRTPLAEQSAAGVEALADFQPRTDVGRDLLHAIGTKWGEGKSCLSIAAGCTAEALALIRAADAAFTQFDTAPLPLRTRSARLLGDSKAIERHLSKLLSFLKATGRLAPDLSRNEALDYLGLAKFPQPVLVAGPIAVRGANTADLAYVGVPPEAMSEASLAGPVRSILTIENLESFHRHVREARGPDDVVIYCGGFPAQGVVKALRHIVNAANASVIHHWGDIDVGGVRIGRFIEASLPVTVVPHLMSSDIAVAYGQKKAPSPELTNIAEESSFASLAAFLASENSHWLEQEVLDPAPV